MLFSFLLTIVQYCCLLLYFPSVRSFSFARLIARQLQMRCGCGFGINWNSLGGNKLKSDDCCIHIHIHPGWMRKTNAGKNTCGWKVVRCCVREIILSAWFTSDGPGGNWPESVMTAGAGDTFCLSLLSDSSKLFIRSILAFEVLVSLVRLGFLLLFGLPL